MYTVKKYNNDGTFDVLARKSNIEAAFYQHLQALNLVENDENITTTNSNGIIYGRGNDIKRFIKNKGCSFAFKYGFEDKYKK
jgi:hypothetical protein